MDEDSSTLTLLKSAIRDFVEDNKALDSAKSLKSENEKSKEIHLKLDEELESQMKTLLCHWANYVDGEPETIHDQARKLLQEAEESLKADTVALTKLKEEKNRKVTEIKNMEMRYRAQHELLEALNDEIDREDTKTNHPARLLTRCMKAQIRKVDGSSFTFLLDDCGVRKIAYKRLLSEDAENIKNNNLETINNLASESDKQVNGNSGYSKGFDGRNFWPECSSLYKE